MHIDVRKRSESTTNKSIFNKLFKDFKLNTILTMTNLIDYKNKF